MKSSATRISQACFPRFLTHAQPTRTIYVRSQSWYSIPMANAYLGLISRRGLESLVVETEHAALFILRRAQRRTIDDAHCCWAVLDDVAARHIMRQIDSRQFEDAFQRLRIESMRFGTIASPDDGIEDEGLHDSLPVWTPP